MKVLKQVVRAMKEEELSMGTYVDQRQMRYEVMETSRILKNCGIVQKANEVVIGWE